MRTTERMTKMKAWLYEELCKGRDYKCPVLNSADAPKIDDFTRTEPKVFLAWTPLTPGKAPDMLNTAPSLTLMPTNGYIRYNEEQRFDRYRKISRPPDFGETITTQILFTLYEPGIREVGFAESIAAGTPDLSLLKDGTEAGFLQLINWMDDCKELIRREQCVPGTDLILEDKDAIWAMYTDQNYIVDRRPYYYGFVNVTWRGYASPGNDHGQRGRAARLLDDGDENAGHGVPATGSIGGATAGILDD